MWKDAAELLGTLNEISRKGRAVLARIVQVGLKDFQI
jgi:hypothetical protein